MFFALFGWRKASKCKKLIKRVQRRLNLLKNKRHSIVRQLREDVAQLIKTGYEDVAFNRAELLFEDENAMAIYELLDNFCEFVIINMPYIRRHKDCPNDVNEAVSTLIFASARCGDVPELRAVRKLFGQHYGQRFEKTALELLPGNLVNIQVKEKLSISSVRDDVKQSLVDEIAVDYCVRPEIFALEYVSELQQQEHEQHQILDTDVQENDSKTEESQIEVLNDNYLEGKAILIDSTSIRQSSASPLSCQNCHTSSTSMSSSIVQHSSPDMLEPTMLKQEEKEDNFAGLSPPSVFKAVAAGRKESQLAHNSCTTTPECKEEQKVEASSSESLPQFPEEMIVYLDDVEEVESITKEGSCQDQRIFKFKSSPVQPKSGRVEDCCDIKFVDEYESSSEKSSSGSSRKRVDTSGKISRRRSLSRERSNVKDIECVIYYEKPSKRSSINHKHRSDPPSGYHKKAATEEHEHTCHAGKWQKQPHHSNHCFNIEAEHCCLNHPCYFCTCDGRVALEVPPGSQKRGITVIHHCYYPSIGESDTEMEWYSFPQRPRRKSCEFGAPACDIFTDPDWQPDRQSKPMNGKPYTLDSKCSSVSSKDSYPKGTSPLTGQQTKAPYQRAMTMPQERSKYSNRENFDRCSSFPIQSPVHVHPKLPDCDDIAAKFMALKREYAKNRKI